MKIASSSLLIITALLFTAATPPLAKVSQKIIDGFQQGKAEMISAFFSETIELNAPGVEGLHSKDQANFILKDFFRNHKPSRFFIKHNGDSKNGAHYSIGELTTHTGVYRVYLLYFKDGDNMSITELRIEADD